MTDIALGITLPLKRGKTGYFEQSFDVIEQTKSNMINLILTRRGERPFQPDLGSELHNLIFTQMDDEYEKSVKNAVASAVRRWLPFVNIVEQVVTRNESKNSTLIEITFSLRTNIDITETIVVSF